MTSSSRREPQDVQYPPWDARKLCMQSRCKHHFRALTSSTRARPFQVSIPERCFLARTVLERTSLAASLLAKTIGRAVDTKISLGISIGLRLGFGHGGNRNISSPVWEEARSSHCLSTGLLKSIFRVENRWRQQPLEPHPQQLHTRPEQSINTIKTDMVACRIPFVLTMAPLTDEANLNLQC